MNQELIDKYTAMPMAITVFNQDKNNFDKFKMKNLYLDKLNAVIEDLKKDFYALKKDRFASIT